MAIETGSATDYIDLADKLRAFLLANGWTILQFTAGNVTTGGMSLNVRGPGTDVNRRVFVNIRSAFSDTSSAYAWEFRGATGYGSGQDFTTQPGTSGTSSFLSLWKNPISYWFYCNDRCFKVEAKVNTAYLGMYAGFFLPFALPSEYPFPLITSGNTGVLTAYSSTANANRMFSNPGAANVSSSSSAKYRHPTGVWKEIYNQDTIGFGGATATPALLPFGSTNIGSFVDTVSCRNSWNQSSAAARFKTVATAQGDRLLLPVTLMDNQAPIAMGTLDGIYFPIGGDLVVEQIATYGSRNFRCFIDVFRTASANLMVIEEVA